jgi:hypothetical protein
MVWVITPIATLAIRVMSVMRFSFFWTAHRLHAHHLCAATQKFKRKLRNHDCSLCNREMQSH